METKPCRHDFEKFDATKLYCRRCGEWRTAPNYTVETYRPYIAPWPTAYPYYNPWWNTQTITVGGTSADFGGTISTNAVVTF